MPALLVFLGGFAGALTRYAADRLIQSRHAMLFPWGTLTVNLIGSLVAGFVVGSVPATSSWAAFLVITGFCGALTTFSTFGLETVRLVEGGALLEAGFNVVGTVLLGLVCVTAGYAAGDLVAGF